MDDPAGIFASEIHLYGFMIVNGLAVLGFLFYSWKKGLFRDSEAVAMTIFEPEEQRGDLND